MEEFLSDLKFERVASRIQDRRATSIFSFAPKRADGSSFYSRIRGQVWIDDLDLEIVHFEYVFEKDSPEFLSFGPVRKKTRYAIDLTRSIDGADEKMKRRILPGITMAFVLFAGSAIAQARNAARRVEVSYSPYGFVASGGPTRQGGCSGVAVSTTDSVALVSEFCGTHQYVSGAQVDSLVSYRSGVRFSKRTGGRITTFVQGLAGGESGYRNAGFADNSGFSFNAGGGVDVGLKNWLSLRIVQASYQMTRVDGATVMVFGSAQHLYSA